MNKKMSQAIELALKKEDASYKHYLKLYSSATDSNLKKLFNNLAIQELRHQALLKEYQKTEDFFEAKTNVSGRFEQNFSITRELNPSSEVTDMVAELKNALEKEKKSEKLYRELVNETKNEDLKSLFLMLADEEIRHKKMLKDEYDKLIS